MAILSSCCCWKSLRKACCAAAIYSSFYYALIATFVLNPFKTVDLPIQSTSNYSMTDDSKELIPHESVDHPSILMPISHSTNSWNGVILQIGLVLSIVGIVTSLLLIIGIWKDKKLLLFPWIIIAVLMILHDLLYVGYLGYTESMSLNPAVAMVLTIDFFLIILNCYSILCVISQFQEFKSGRGRIIDERPEQTIPPAMSSCETGRRNVTVYESKCQANGISPRQSRMSFRNPSIKISKIDKKDENQGGLVSHQSGSAFVLREPNVKCSDDSSKNFSISDCAGTPATSSTSGASESSSSIQRSDSKKKVQFPLSSDRESSSNTEQTADVSDISATTECESSTGRDWTTDKSQEDSPLILLQNQKNNKF